MARSATRTGGRDATRGVIPGRYALSVGNPHIRVPQGWRWTALSEVARLESGHTPSRRQPDYWGGDIPWIGIADATGNHGRTVFCTAETVTQDGIDNSSARILPSGTVCLSRTASVGYVVVMGRPMATSQDFINWICSDALDNRYLKYIFLAERDSLLRFASGTTHQTIYFPEAKALHVCLPPIDEQREIADVLNSMDDKIELNRRMHETLEATARAIFESWFGTIPSANVTAAELIMQRDLEVGDGYRAKNSELGDAGLPFIRAAELKNGFNTEHAEKLLPDSVAKAGSKISRVGDVAFTSKGTIGRLARVGEHTPRFVYSPQVCYWRSLDPSRLHPALLYCWMQTRDFRNQLDAVAGQTDMAPYVSLQDQRAMKVPAFPQSQSEVAGRIEPILKMQSQITAESRTLAELRDALLPKLLSGDVRLKKAAARGRD